MGVSGSSGRRVRRIPYEGAGVGVAHGGTRGDHRHGTGGRGRWPGPAEEGGNNSFISCTVMLLKNVLTLKNIKIHLNIFFLRKECDKLNKFTQICLPIRWRTLDIINLNLSLTTNKFLTF